MKTIQAQENNQPVGNTKELPENLFIFRTDIKTKKKVKTVKPVFNDHPLITRWSVDTEDIDNVLKIKTAGRLTENDIINLMKAHGFFCEALPD